ncbi:hypothetical protein P3X46_018644 [Hevea brasiliensis]|uniref:Uncharacterized protein n=1 Tax=Hevea brasiliensis TaxID=3981 RepID=A0ABQ9LVG5_HEVBR|nr:uncharacterized protein LOC110650642 [Hevea brasiliensis]KAJ9170544.1 hypothetical protein P3X46_018644 [Hevea brasiliensis]
MRREEKRRKFHEALLNTLYPPKPEPQAEDEKEPLSTPGEDFDVNLIPDDYGLRQCSSSTSEDDGESDCGQQKLTRAQRKRLRKKKLKEENSRRREIIGPLLPPSNNDSGGDGSGAVDEDTPGARENADDSHGNQSSGSKVKQRRMAKRLGRERLKSQRGDV